MDHLRLILQSMITSSSQDYVVLKNNNSMSKGPIFKECEQAVVGGAVTLETIFISINDVISYGSVRFEKTLTLPAESL